MSLLVDPNFLLQSLRLDFLANVPDPFGPGTITFPDVAAPYVADAGLDDPELWPELRDVRSPEPYRVDIHAGPSRRKAGGGRLQYSETIGGSHGAGMRVDGKKRSWPGRRGNRSVSATPRARQESEGSDNTPSYRTTRRVSKDKTAGHQSLSSGGESAEEGFTDLKGKGKAVALELTFDDEEDEAEDEAEEGTEDEEPLSPLPGDEAEEEDIQLPTMGAPPQRRRMASFFGSPRNPPLVTIDSPVTSPHRDAPHRERDVDEATIRSAGENEEEVALPLMRRPPTLTQASSFSHDQELSEALRLNDGAISMDPASMLSDTATSDDGDLQTMRLKSSTEGEDLTGSTQWSVVSPVNGTYPPTASSGDDEFSYFNQGLVGRISTSSEPLPVVVEKEEETAPIAQGDQAREGLAPPSEFRPRERRRVNISFGVPLQVLPIPPATEGATKSQNDRMPSPTQAMFLRDRSRTNSSDRKPTSPTTAPQQLPSTASQNTATADAAVSSTAPMSGPRRSKPMRKDTLETFPIRKVPITKRGDGPSGLSALLAHRLAPESHNPFTPTYGAAASRSGDALKLTLFFPHSNEPSRKMPISVRRDVTVEEVIGFGLWSYWESKREPRLGPDDADELEGQMDPAAWNLMMAEEDGEVDDDFPALDRLQPISKVGTSEFGLTEATAAQVAENKLTLEAIIRRPSRVVAPLARVTRPFEPGTTARTIGGSSLARIPDIASSSLLAGSLIEPATVRPSGVTMGEPDVLLRIQIPSAATGDGTVVTAVKVPSAMYLQDVLELVCRKRAEYLKGYRDFALLLGNQDIVVPLDRTVESLQGIHSLRLVRKAQYAELLAKQTRSPDLRNTNPTAPITKRLSEPMGPKYVSAVDVMAPYKEWVVSRKHAMSLSRHDRLFVLDGDYVTIRSMSTGRTSSYHCSNIVECRASRRVPGSFKFTVSLENRDIKRFDFDANSKEAVEEITSSVRTMLQVFRARRTVRVR